MILLVTEVVKLLVVMVGCSSPSQSGLNAKDFRKIESKRNLSTVPVEELR